MKAKFTIFHALSMDKRLTKLHNQVFQEVLAFARFKSKNPKLQDLIKHPELETLCDALLLVRSGALEVELTDCLPGSENEGIVLRLNLG